eukprot:TRINITY_DN4692_c0_g1_i2.p1 TRINITY_DN4692_c0_g1~~TRINITY_DN4692_c0_g1_i2.p1  ORF type:complete len:131 (+),score=33.61 TRINITY_DN4692_c0_g1_i2:69-461(+)
MDRGFSDDEFMARLAACPQVRPTDFIDTKRGARPSTNATKTAAPKKITQAKPVASVAADESPSSAAAFDVSETMSDEQFWSALKQQLSTACDQAQAQKLLTTMKSRHKRNIASMSLDQMDRMAAAILGTV